jgi:hypothetical protein
MVITSLYLESDGAPLLTDDEHRCMELTAEVANLLSKIVGNDRTRTGDLQELVAALHTVQNAVLAQAAGRAYPKRYRLLGGVIT